MDGAQGVEHQQIIDLRIGQDGQIIFPQFRVAVAVVIGIIIAGAAAVEGVIANAFQHVGQVGVVQVPHLVKDAVADMLQAVRKGHAEDGRAGEGVAADGGHAVRDDQQAGIGQRMISVPVIKAQDLLGGGHHFMAAVEGVIADIGQSVGQLHVEQIVILIECIGFDALQIARQMDGFVEQTRTAGKAIAANAGDAVIQGDDDGHGPFPADAVPLMADIAAAEAVAAPSHGVQDAVPGRRKRLGIGGHGAFAGDVQIPAADRTPVMPSP